MISHKDIKREMINTKARIRYKELKESGNNKKIIPIELQKKRGRKPKPKDTEPAQETPQKQTTEQLNRQYNILKKLTEQKAVNNYYIIRKLKELNRQNQYIKKDVKPPEPEEQKQPEN